MNNLLLNVADRSFILNRSIRSAGIGGGITGAGIALDAASGIETAW